ncbi:MAG: glycosyltransferase family 4 protein [Micavibrio aeruginosavorus]|uniref:Glycosyltransferase family 4 protein n=1 Tax=Micavibrio aeruginosavorus TaxID=349221 RepID=A0A7T5R2J0_9BACT|nr:MAG: glycosyltransferase family 4 protein [Micavibrio aeruginosavorus]
MKARSLKIAMPTPAFLPNMGGMEVGLHNIACRLADRGHEPCVIMPATQYRALKRSDCEFNYDIAPFWPKTSAITEHWPNIGLRFHGMFFRYYQHRYKPDVWHSTMIYPTGTGLFYGLGTAVPSLARAAGNDIQISHDADYGIRRDPRADHIIRTWGCGLSAYVAITETVRQEYLALGIPDEKIFFIPNGVDLQRFNRPRNRKILHDRHGIAEDSFLFLSVGRNHPKKNYKTLIEAFGILCRRNPEAQVQLAIAGDKVSELSPLAARERLTAQIHLIERIGIDAGDLQNIELPADPLIDLYKGADVFVFPSLIETFGIAIVEAMAAGLPCIISDAPGCRDITAQGVHALDFPPLNKEALAEKMEEFLHHRDLRIKWQDKSKARAAAYDWDHIVTQYENLYLKLTGVGA